MCVKTAEMLLENELRFLSKRSSITEAGAFYRENDVKIDSCSKDMGELNT